MPNGRGIYNNQAETDAYPELRLVILMHGDRLTYGPTFDQALEKLLASGGLTVTEKPLKPAVDQPITAENLQQAKQALEEYMRYTCEGRFQEADDSMATLRQILERLNLETGQENP